MTPKKNMFLRLGALCLALVMCLGMAACHEQGTKNPAGNTTGSNETAQDVTYNGSQNPRRFSPEGHFRLCL